MAIFKENENHLWKEVALTALLAMLMFLLWNIGGHEMSQSEGAYALQICEWEKTGHFTLLAHATADTPVCYLFLVKVARDCGLSMECALRIMTVLPYLLLTVLTFYAVLRTRGLYAAYATVMFLLTFLILHKTYSFGTPNALTALGIYGGWLLWVELGVKRVKWTCAWIALGVIGALIYSNGGYPMLALFLVPMLLQHKSVNPLRKISSYQTGAVSCLLLIGITVAFLHSLSLGFPGMPQSAEQASVSFDDILKYGAGFLKFPFKWFWYMLPGSLFIWAPFCAALVSIDKNPLSGKIQRCIFGTMFVMMWVLPYFRDKDLCLMAPVTAVLLGAKFEIVVRRYGYRIQRFLKVFAAVSLFFGLLLIWHANSMWIGPLDCLEKIPFAKDFALTLKNYFHADTGTLKLQFLQASVALAAVLFALLSLTVKRGGALPLSLCSIIVLLFCSGIMFHHFFRDVRYAAEERECHDFADFMKSVQKDGKEQVIYTNIFRKFPEYYYFMEDGRASVKYIDIDRVPEKADEVLYLSENQIPPFVNHTWGKIGEKTGKNVVYSIYIGKKLGD